MVRRDVVALAVKALCTKMRFIVLLLLKSFAHGNSFAGEASMYI